MIDPRAVIMLGMLILLVALLMAGGSRAADNCILAQDNLNAMQARAQKAIDEAAKFRRASSARKLAVLEAARAQGYYTAMQTMLPLACKDGPYTSLDQQISIELPKMQTYVQQNW